MIPNDRRYLETHEWAKPEGDVVSVGISDFAVKHLTDLVYLALPRAGERVKKGERFGEIESVKAVSDLMSPVSGTIAEVNDVLKDRLDDVASDPYGKGWMIKVRCSDLSPLEKLLDAAAYEKMIAS